ncbi:MAG: hypothetical protein FJZ63_00625 [Chlamydiae bacterium]|nr:hypothetical protein [Chlamydiota bacterium]
MQGVVSFPKVVALTQRFGEAKYSTDHVEIAYVIRDLLGRRLEEISFRKWLQEELPMVVTSSLGTPPFHLSVVLLCKKKPHIGRFFMEMVTKWLIPGKLVAGSFYSMRDFRFEDREETVYSLVEMRIPMERAWDVEQVMRHLDLLIQEIRLGVTSTYQGRCILEMKGISGQDKVGIIQEEITRVLERFPERFDYDIFTLMQHFFVITSEEFKRIRACTHLIRWLTSFYLLRKDLRLKVEMFPGKRQVDVFLKKAELDLPLGKKHVLSVYVGLNFLREHEVFAKRHLVRAIQTSLPYSRAIEESYLEIEEPESSVRLFYLEIEKEDKTPFFLEEMKKLKNELPHNLKGRVEHLLRPIFMPRNEEEVMRNIILLAQQLKYVKDLPQVVITFDEQSDKELFFTVILAHVVGEIPVEQALGKIEESYEPVIERKRQIGLLRNRYVKEALVIRLKLPSLPFLREDDSVDLYVARREVLSEIQKAFGEVRDFNGGMISKQSEAFLALKKILGVKAQPHKLLLENFFHSIYPIECRSTLNPGFLSRLFLMLLEPAKKQNKGCGWTLDQEGEAAIALIDFYEIGYKQKILDAVHSLGILSRKLVQMHLQTVDSIRLGFIYLEYDKGKKQLFLETLKAALDF